MTDKNSISRDWRQTRQPSGVRVRGMATDGALDYDVFVSDPLPLATGKPLPNGQPRLFSPLSSTLIYGERDVLLADPPLDVGQVGEVGDWIEARGKTLTHVFITHGHGDHWF